MLPKCSTSELHLPQKILLLYTLLLDDVKHFLCCFSTLFMGKKKKTWEDTHLSSLVAIDLSVLFKKLLIQNHKNYTLRVFIVSALIFM